MSDTPATARAYIVTDRIGECRQCPQCSPAGADDAGLCMRRDKAAVRLHAPPPAECPLPKWQEPKKQESQA